MKPRLLALFAFGLVEAIAAACSSSSNAPAADAGATAEAGGSSGGPNYIDDSGLEHYADGGLTDRGCNDLAERVAQARQNAKACANVPGVCLTTVRDECGCQTYVEDVQNDYAKTFTALALRLFDSTCPKK